MTTEPPKIEATFVIRAKARILEIRLYPRLRGDDALNPAAVFESGTDGLTARHSRECGNPGYLPNMAVAHLDTCLCQCDGRAATQFDQLFLHRSWMQTKNKPPLRVKPQP